MPDIHKRTSLAATSDAASAKRRGAKEKGRGSGIKLAVALVLLAAAPLVYYVMNRPESIPAAAAPASDEQANPADMGGQETAEPVVEEPLPVHSEPPVNG